MLGDLISLLLGLELLLGQMALVKRHLLTSEDVLRLLTSSLKSLDLLNGSLQHGQLLVDLSGGTKELRGWSLLAQSLVSFLAFLGVLRVFLHLFIDLLPSLLSTFHDGLGGLGSLLSGFSISCVGLLSELLGQFLEHQGMSVQRHRSVALVDKWLVKQLGGSLLEIGRSGDYHLL